MSEKMLCLSSWLAKEGEYSPFYQRFTKELKKRRERWRLLEKTRDIWCRDFLPVYGAGGEPVQFRYEPGYLKGKDRYRSRPEEFLPELGITPRYCSLNLDGGNILIHGNIGIVSDRIFSENKEKDCKKVEEELRSVLELNRLIVIPSDLPRNDMTGHSDGMCRFIDDKHILLNDFGLNPGLGKEVTKCLRDAGLEVSPLQVDSGYYTENRDWLCAINFYECDHALYVPVLGMKYEEHVLRQMERCYQRKEIVPIDSSEIVRDGGALNCVSWERKERITK